MKKILFALFISISVTQAQDLIYTYIETKIGDQSWMYKNLDITFFRNGDEIPEAKTIQEWKALSDAGKPAWCYYQNFPDNNSKYGKIYNWYAVADPRGLAPEGWHVASEEEWTIMEKYLVTTPKKNLKPNESWSVFTEYLGGFRDYGGPFNGESSYNMWWTSTVLENEEIRTILLSSSDKSLTKFSLSKDNGFYVRCIKD
jgi:uncharacterized protein (TIGR02145 family)